jgi:hypothetical protein
MKLLAPSALAEKLPRGDLHQPFHVRLKRRSIQSYELKLMRRSSFDITVWNDKTDLAQKAFANAKEPVGKPNLPALGVYLLVGNDIQTKAYNLHRNLDEERVSLIEAVAVKPNLRATSI